MSQLSWDVFVAPELALAGDDLPPGLSTRTWGPVSATLIMGREDAVLVDALLTTAQATALAGWIQARGRNLTTVYVTHGHGDHFFGLPVILDRFPRAKAVALPGAIEVMREQLVPPVSAYYDAILPGQIPGRRTLPGPLAAGPITLDGHALIPVELGHTDTAATTCLHVPSLGLVVAGDAVYNSTHVFTGESDASARRQWRAALDVIASLSPRTVIAGHKPPGADDSPRHIELTRRYLDDFDRLQAAVPGAAALYEAMLSRYPAWASPGTLWGSIRAQAAST
jgi:glyoxylase-like metal-dependent hydrolase (beta-lactamase superfamily II)